jgi:hypothetical protein
LNAIWAIPAFVFSQDTRSYVRSYDTSKFKVHSLPDSPALPTSWAGRLPVPGRADGNEIFFWLFQAERVEYNDTLISMYHRETYTRKITNDIEFGSMAVLAVRR